MDAHRRTTVLSIRATIERWTDAVTICYLNWTLYRSTERSFPQSYLLLTQFNLPMYVYRIFCCASATWSSFQLRGHGRPAYWLTVTAEEVLVFSLQHDMSHSQTRFGPITTSHPSPLAAALA